MSKEKKKGYYIVEFDVAEHGEPHRVEVRTDEYGRNPPKDERHAMGIALEKVGSHNGGLHPRFGTDRLTTKDDPGFPAGHPITVFDMRCWYEEDEE